MSLSNFKFVQTSSPQTYTVNMLVMSLVSEIAYIPHDSVTLLLLDTSLPSPPLYSALLDVSQQFQDIFEVRLPYRTGRPGLSSLIVPPPSLKQMREEPWSNLHLQQIVPLLEKTYQSQRLTSHNPL